MKRIISLSAILISLSLILIGSMIIMIINQGDYRIFDSICTVLILISFFGFCATIALLIKQSRLPE